LDEAHLRKEIEREIRAKIEAETEARLREEQRRRELNAAFTPALRSANRESAWERQGARGAAVTDATEIIGAALADQMIAGLRGTDLHEDGMGDGT
jgi:hypothetical protein